MKKILLIDDDQGILDALSIFLNDYGYKVIKMSGNQNAIQKKITDEKPNLIILDILLSGEDGRDICKFLKENKEIKKTPIILTSARKDFKDSALKAGANFFIAKPFDVGELIDKVEDLVS